MSRIKIISNPYTKAIAYYKWQETSQEWSPINYENNPNSALLSERYNKGFFTLVAAAVVHIIVSEYHDGTGPVELIFEGTADDYNELLEICSSEENQNAVKLIRSEFYLESARDILPVINRTFREKISPLVASSVRDRSKISKDLARFSEAANDIVPVCVIGNYSTGKSTFINALIGNEILPSGDVPVTAKIYRIERSQFDDRAYIRFNYMGEETELRFDESGWHMMPDLIGTEFRDQLERGLAKPEINTITARVRNALALINFFEDSTPDIQEISDLIQVIVPFGAASCGYAGGDFVVFDTPGSNSASNVNHAEVLHSAMENMTNGLPIFVTEYDKLDSTDNESLYHQLLNMEELDSTYTAIVVNKADTASLPKKGFTVADREQLLSFAVPRQLYSDGIFFVTSIMGLGAKINGDFFDDHCAEIYEDQSHKYADATSRFYKQLYKYNTQPEPFASAARKDTESCTDLIFANSGLYAVEREIRNFAVRFSPYNKSTQARRFLTRVIAVTDEELQAQRNECELSKQQLEEKLESDKLALIKQVESVSTKQRETYITDYPEMLQPTLDAAMAGCDAETLRAWQTELVAAQQSELGLDSHVEERKQSFNALGTNLRDNFRSAVKNRKLADLRNLGSSFVDDAKNALDQTSQVFDTQREINRIAADQLIERAKDSLNSRILSGRDALDTASRTCWGDNCKTLKSALLEVIAGAEVLTEQRQKELSEIIITYGEIEFHMPDDQLFDPENLKKGFAFKNLFGVGDILNIENLQRSYNDALTSAIIEIRDSLRADHEQSFRDWLDSLVSTLTKNIVSYSPELSRLSDLIEKDKEIIRDLTQRREKLSAYAEQISDMMNWKEA